MTDVVVILTGGWGSDGWGVAAFGEDTAPAPAPAMTTSVGSVTVIGDAILPQTGLAATGGVGSVTATGVSRVEVSGVAATGEVNSLRFDALVTFAGWGRGGWGEGAWSENVTVAAAVGGVGSVEVTGTAVVPQAGLSASGNVGSVTIVPGAGVAVELVGVSSTPAVGDVEVTGGAGVPTTGLAAIASVGEVTQRTTQVVPAFAPAAAVGSVGTVTVFADANVFVSGVEASTVVQPVLVWGKIIPDPGTIWTEIAA